MSLFFYFGQIEKILSCGSKQNEFMKNHSTLARVGKIGWVDSKVTIIIKTNEKSFENREKAVEMAIFCLAVRQLL